MNRFIRSVKSFSFHFRWIFMSGKSRYAYLWAKTEKLGDLDYAIRASVPDAVK